MTRTCERCGDETADHMALPFAQWRERHSGPLILCSECREQMVEWIEGESHD